MGHCLLPDCFFRVWTKVKQNLFSIHFSNLALFFHAYIPEELSTLYSIFCVSGCEAFFLMSSRPAFLDNMQSTLDLHSFWLKKNTKKERFEAPNQVFKAWFVVRKTKTNAKRDKAEIQQVRILRLWSKIFNLYKLSLVFTYMGDRYPLFCSSWLISYIFMYILWASWKEVSVRSKWRISAGECALCLPELSRLELNQLFWFSVSFAFRRNGWCVY